MNFNFMNNGQHDQDKFHNPLLYNFNSTVTNTENTNWNSSNISNDYNNKGYQTLQQVMSSMQQSDSQRQPLTSKPKYTSKKRYGPEDFQVLKLLGKGTFGQVYQVRGKKTNKIYAMKVLSKSVIIKKNEIAHTIGERNILVKTSQDNLDSQNNSQNDIDINFLSSNQNNKRCPFIVGLKFSFQTPTDLYLVIDFMAGGELFWHLQKAGRFSELRTKFYIAELVVALEYLHDNDIIYRDLKPENILLDSEGHIALCDFGLSKDDLKERTKTFCGTTEYLAPELLLDETGYTKMVDFWSLGVLIFEMCCGWSPFFAEDNQQMYQKIAFGKVKFPRDVLSPYGRSFVKGLLNRNPRHRLGAIDDGRELRKHPFLQDIDWELLIEKKIQPPFKPTIQDDLDTSNFDPHFTTHEIDQQMLFPSSGNKTDNSKVKNTPLSQTIQKQFQGFTFVDHSAIPLESPSQNSIANINSSYMNRKLLQNSYFLQQGSFIPGDPNMPADEDVIDENEGWLQEGGVDMDIIDNMTKDEDEDEHMGFQFD